ncbi:hypothetical protein MBLNU459_g7988t1 [Dothideomycetes sp. NU459]
MGIVNRLLALPVLLFVGLPFAGFAVFTTSLALATLFVRVLIIYIDLGLALVSSALYSSSKDTESVTLPPRSLFSEHARARRRRSTASSNTPPMVRKTSSFATLVGNNRDRDFEGVGGWRISGNDDEEALWMGMNARLELPAASPSARKHRRSLTGGSLRFGSPEIARSPAATRTRTPGTSSPEGYFSMHPIGVAYDSSLNLSRISVEERPRSSGVSSVSSATFKPGSKNVSMKTFGIP